MMTGLLLGAGASVDFGMPLVWPLTDDVKRLLTRKKYEEFETAARLRGEGYSDDVKNEVLNILCRDEMHFEALLGYFQVRQLRSRSDSNLRQVYASLYAWFARVVTELLFEQHGPNLNNLYAAFGV